MTIKISNVNMFTHTTHTFTIFVVFFSCNDHKDMANAYMEAVVVWIFADDGVIVTCQPSSRNEQASFPSRLHY